jgi:hypothetical protein
VISGIAGALSWETAGPAPRQKKAQDAKNDSAIFIKLSSNNKHFSMIPGFVHRPAANTMPMSYSLVP